MAVKQLFWNTEYFFDHKLTTTSISLTFDLVLFLGVPEESWSQATCVWQCEPCRTYTEGEMSGGRWTLHTRHAHQTQTQLECCVWQICGQVGTIVCSCIVTVMHIFNEHNNQRVWAMHCSKKWEQSDWWKWKASKCCYTKKQRKPFHTHSLKCFVLIKNHEKYKNDK